MRKQKMDSDIAILRFLEGDYEDEDVVKMATRGIHTTKDLWMLAKMVKGAHEVPDYGKEKISGSSLSDSAMRVGEKSFL